MTALPTATRRRHAPLAAVRLVGLPCTLAFREISL